MLALLPPWCLDEQVRRHEARVVAEGALRPSAATVVAHTCRSALLPRRYGLAESLDAFAERRGIKLEGGKMPYGFFSEFLASNPVLQAQCQTHAERSRVWMYIMRARATVKARGGCLPEGTWKFLPRGDGRQSGPVQEHRRRRARGLQGRPKKTPLVRDLRFEWWSKVRNNSVATRVPPKLVLLIGRGAVRDYIKHCLVEGVRVNPPVITGEMVECVVHGIPRVSAAPEQEVQGATGCARGALGSVLV